MLTYKTSEDFIKMSKAGKVVSNIHYEIYKNTKPGMKLKELDNIAKKIIEKSNPNHFSLAIPNGLFVR